MDVRTVAVATLDWRDLCVNGRGYIETVDDKGENPVWFRCIRLCVNQNGLLCANVKGSMRPIEPPIRIPNDWTHIEINERGEVLIGNSFVSGQTIGSISLSLFNGDDLLDATKVDEFNDQMGAPSTAEPGNNGAGYLMQRTALQYCIPLTHRMCLASAFFALWLAGGIVYSHKMQRPQQ